MLGEKKKHHPHNKIHSGGLNLLSSTAINMLVTSAFVWTVVVVVVWGKCSPITSICSSIYKRSFWELRTQWLYPVSPYLVKLSTVFYCASFSSFIPLPLQLQVSHVTVPWPQWEGVVYVEGWRLLGASCFLMLGILELESMVMYTCTARRSTLGP